MGEWILDHAHESKHLTLKKILWKNSPTNLIDIDQKNKSIESKSEIRIIPHFVPDKTGHAACQVISSPSPFLWRLYQNAAEPFFGQSVKPAEGNTVAPPNSTSDS